MAQITTAIVDDIETLTYQVLLHYKGDFGRSDKYGIRLYSPDHRRVIRNLRKDVLVDLIIALYVDAVNANVIPKNLLAKVKKDLEAGDRPKLVRPAKLWPTELYEGRLTK